MAQLTDTTPQSVPFTVDSPPGVAVTRADRVRMNSGEDLEATLATMFNTFIADSSFVSYDAAGNFIRISPPGIRDVSNQLIMFQLSQGVVNAIGAEDDAQVISVRFGASSVNRRLRVLRNGSNSDIVAGDIPSSPIRYLAVTSGGSVNCFILAIQVDIGS